MTISDLHMSDIAHLLTILNRLVDSGNSVAVIEHNVEVILQHIDQSVTRRFI